VILAVALVAGALIGLSLGALGGGSVLPRAGVRWRCSPLWPLPVAGPAPADGTDRHKQTPGSVHPPLLLVAGYTAWRALPALT
jgi:hypothetical protein